MSTTSWVSPLNAAYGLTNDGTRIYVSNTQDNGGYGSYVNSYLISDITDTSSYLLAGGNNSIGPLTIDDNYVYASYADQSQPYVATINYPIMSPVGITFAFNTYQDGDNTVTPSTSAIVIAGNYLYTSFYGGFLGRSTLTTVPSGDAYYNDYDFGSNNNTYGQSGYNDLNATLSTNTPTALATDNTYLYVGCSTGKIVRMTLSSVSGGNTDAAIWLSGLSGITGLTVSSDNVYLYALSSSASTITQVRLSDGSILSTYSLTGGSYANHLYNGIVSNGSYLYAAYYGTGGDTNNGSILRYGASSDTSLATFTIDGTPVTGGETITVSYGITSVSVVVVTTSSAAYISVDLNEGIPSTGTGSVSDTFSSLSALITNELHVNVTAQDGVTFQQYIVYINIGSAPTVPCFGENTKILCFNSEKSLEEYVLIQDIRKGTLVKTLLNGYLPVDMIGKSTIQNYANNDRIKNRLYKCTKENYPELVYDELILTGCHSILVGELTDEQREKTMEELEKIYITDKNYRLFTFLDPRAETYQVEGEFPIYHLALENENYYMNYGIFANGLLVESCSKRYIKELSGMTLIE